MESSSEVVSKTVGENHENADQVSENAKADEVAADVKVVTNAKAEGENNVKSDEASNEQVSLKENEIEEIIEEEVEESVDSDDAGEDDNQEITEEVSESPDGTEIKTTTITTVVTVNSDPTTAVESTSSVTRDQPTETISSVHSEQEASKPTETPAKEDVKQTEPKAEQDLSESEEETEAEDEEEEEEVKTAVAIKQPDESNQKQLKQDQIPQENETHHLPIPTTTTTNIKEETVVDSPSAVPTGYQQENRSNKQENLNNTLKDIISNIDSNIEAQENIAALKEREMELLKKQQELAKEIEQQKLLAQKLASENQYNQQLNKNFINQNYGITSNPITNVSKYSTFEESHDNGYSRKSETIETRESTNVTKKIDLHKIFTPATDAEEILPKNRKLYASSAFYSPALHPTVEDQVELARRISNSLSDISNQQSRGQSMYVNRKKRSVKWVHEGSGQDDTENENVTNEEQYEQDKKENDASHHKNVPLKFLMNPSGQMRDINSLRESINTETGLLSPDVSAEVVNALQAQKGKGAELFAKRRKVAEKWVVDESNVGAQSPSGLPDYQQYQQQPKASTSPSILPAYTDAAKHRVQLNLHQEQLLEKYTKPGLKVVQTPWEAALNSGSASAAFVEEQKLSPYPSATLTPSPTPQIYDASQGGIPITSTPTATDSYSKTDYQSYQTQYSAPYQKNQPERQLYAGTNSKRELAYKPSIPQGWKAPSMSLPTDLYMPKEIPLQSYAPPPVTNIPSPVSNYSSYANFETNQHTAYKPLNSSQTETAPSTGKAYGAGATFPVSKPYQQGFSSTYGHIQPPKQQYLPPQSYQKVPQNSSQNVPQVNFNPSPLPYDKLAKFENPPADEGRPTYSPSSRASYLNVRGNKIRNTSPAPFTAADNRPYTPSSDSHCYGGASSISPRPLSSTQQYCGQTTPNLSHPSVTPSQLLHAPTYNTPARGWGCGGSASTGHHYPQSHFMAEPQIINASSMPYTDF